MSAEEKRHVDREMARGLCTALEPLLAGRRDALVMEAVCNVAQLLVLPGLERLLTVLAAHPHATPSAEVRHVVERLRRESERALAQSSLLTFYAADRELGAFATHLEGIEWKEAGEGEPIDATPDGPREPVMGLVHALGSWRLANEASVAAAAGVRLTAPVAAVLRAALDWLFGVNEPQAALRVAEDAGIVEVECHGVDPDGLLPAHEVIASVGGCLGPSPAGERDTWTLRLPAVAERESFLMLQQDALNLALPWSNVLRIQLDTPENQPLPAPPLAPLTPLTGARRGRPVVTVGLGLRRGSLALDRLVWRLAAAPADVDSPPPAGTTRAVRSDDGEVFWVIDVAKLMRDVPLPGLPEARGGSAEADVEARRPPGASAPAAADAADASPPAPADRPRAGEPEPAAPAPPTSAPDSGRASPTPRGTMSHAPPRLVLLQRENVESLGDMPAPGRAVDPGPAAEPEATPAEASPVAVPHAPQAPPASKTPPGRRPVAAPAPPARRSPAPAPGTTDPAPAPGTTDPAPAPGHGRRALVAEDSFMARIFLIRLLQAQGYNVHSVGTAQELRGALAGESWALVCVDVDLPDARGAVWIREVSESQLEQQEPAVVIALVRDRTDEQQAAEGGVSRVLLKPFSQRDVVRLLERVGLPSAGPR